MREKKEREGKREGGKEKRAGVFIKTMLFISL